MQTAFIFHGIEGSPDENWIPWLRQQLEQAGLRVVVPAFPHPDRPLLSEWMAHMEQYRAELGEDAILIGHSMGAAFALRLLATLDHPVHATILVAPVWEVMGNPFDPRMQTFEEPAHDWKSVRMNGGECSVFYSDNDPYISVAKSKALAAHLDADQVFVAGAGHFNKAAGYLRFDALLEKIKGMILV